MGISSWQEEIRGSLQDTARLLGKLGLETRDISIDSNSSFPLKATDSFLSRIVKQDPDDPLLRQILPLQQENARQKGFVSDPVGDLEAETVPGLLHKYQGRVLLVATGACAIHCRYCFRRHFPYTDSNPAKQNWNPALEYIQKDDSITEVILSGGDPLMLSDKKLQYLMEALEAVPHLKRLRFHTRIPTVLPSRITESFLALFHNYRLTPLIVLHTNHPNEIDADVKSVLRRIAASQISLLNQTVLLRGVNDSSQVLATLNEKLFECGVLPYYLHLLDRVEGAAEFEVDEFQAKKIMRELREILPGYLVPRLVREQAGAPYKLPVL